MVAQTEVFAERDPDEKLIALQVATIMSIADRDGVTD